METHQLVVGGQVPPQGDGQVKPKIDNPKQDNPKKNKPKKDNTKKDKKGPQQGQPTEDIPMETQESDVSSHDPLD